jgi:hypothetical protein
VGMSKVDVVLIVILSSESQEWELQGETAKALCKHQINS